MGATLDRPVSQPKQLIEGKWSKRLPTQSRLVVPANLWSLANFSRRVGRMRPRQIDLSRASARRPLPPTDDNSVHDNPQAATMSASLNKIAANSPSRQNPSELETQIATALHDLETNTADLKAALRPLQIVSAREVRTIR